MGGGGRSGGGVCGWCVQMRMGAVMGGSEWQRLGAVMGAVRLGIVDVASQL